jgi:alkanesulfonate monooxygenase SsuD/methylene tetrahydromethanopterin reductase-like flavin-dependent oxidoreductase (luciferase family)
MRISINMPLLDGHGEPLDSAGIASRAQAVEAAGLEGIWIGDGFSPGMTRPDPLMWLLVAATGTRKIEVGTSILIVPLRHPVELAQRLLTLQALTRGRFTLGAGAGSTRSTYESFGLDFDRRFTVLERYLAEVKRLCAGEVVGTADLNPWPRVRGGPPILIGAWHSQVWLRRAVERYDGWMCSAGRTNLVTMREALKRYRDLGGGRALVSTCMIDLRAPTSRLSEDDPFHLRCSPEEAGERLQLLADLGFDDVLLVKADHTRRLSIYEADFTVEDLEEIRGLIPTGGV